MSIKKKKKISWYQKYNSLEEYYNSEYGQTYTDPNTGEPHKFYSFDKYQLEIDPEETLEEIENYDIQKQEEEIVKCAQSFAYFCHKYCKIVHPKFGLIPFIMFNYQKFSVENFEKKRYNIVSKFRQGGLTTTAVIWAAWRCLFKLEQTIVIISKTDREGTKAGALVDKIIEHFPTWLKPEGTDFSKHEKKFGDTGSSISCGSPNIARGLSATFIIIDEAAFVKNMDEHWKAMSPIIATGGSVIAISTVNGVGNWYHETYTNAEERGFNVIDLDYWQHPYFNDPKWVKSERAKLGERGWRQEVLRSFLGSGETYIPHNILLELEQRVKNIECNPIRKLFPEWANQEEIPLDEGIEYGALWIWKESQPGREYIIGVDCAEGIGSEGDNSVFEVLDLLTCEQVAEFYSNKIPPHAFSTILSQVGNMYNSASIVIENMASAGGAVINAMEHIHYYENLYRNSSRQHSVGIRVSPQVRSTYLETIQNKLMNKGFWPVSKRVIDELNTFVYNTTAKKAQASKGKHDDAIMAICIALYVRDSLDRNLPVGSTPVIQQDELKKSQTELQAKIQEELKRGIFEELEEYSSDPLGIFIDKEQFTHLNVKRPYDSLLKELGW